MEITKIIKSNILYYFIAAIVYMCLMIAAIYVFPSDSTSNSTLNFYLILPIVSIALGFVSGGAKSYAKWGFPIYIALLSFCLSIYVYFYANWALICLAFGASLVGVAIRHFMSKRRRNAK